MSLLARIDVAGVREKLSQSGIDGWLLYDFHGINPIARRAVGLSGFTTRRWFVWLPREGEPVAVIHQIEQQPFAEFPGTVKVYSRWQELDALLGTIVRGKQVAMEYYPGDAVPYLDRVPAGLVRHLEDLGGRVVSSADFVSSFASRWSSAELSNHREAAEKIAAVAREVINYGLERIGSVREAELQRMVLERFDSNGLVTNEAPIVGFGANAANPHYEPHAGSDAVLEEGQVFLLDLWAGTSLETVFADQTWMAFAGSAPPDDVLEVWTTVRDARDQAASLLRERCQAGKPVMGAELDRAARDHITRAGYGDYFIHRTGHSIDLELHGSGPHLDDFETNDTRVLVEGVGFSIEPGIYLPGRFGVRSEINAVVLPDGPEFTPSVIQRDLILPV